MLLNNTATSTTTSSSTRWTSTRHSLLRHERNIGTIRHSSTSLRRPHCGQRRLQWHNLAFTGRDQRVARHVQEPLRRITSCLELPPNHTPSRHAVCRAFGIVVTAPALFLNNEYQGQVETHHSSSHNTSTSFYLCTNSVSKSLSAFIM